jgi:hypothetical protein
MCGVTEGDANHLANQPVSTFLGRAELALSRGHAMRHYTNFDYPKLPECIRKDFSKLAAEVADLSLKLRIYRQLFTPETSDLLANVGLDCFTAIEESLRSDMIMTFGRLNDSPRWHTKDNISLARLVETLEAGDPDRPQGLPEQLEAIRVHCGERLEKLRNKTTGHCDRDQALQPHLDPIPPVDQRYVTKAWKMIIEFMDTIQCHYGSGTTPFEHGPMLGSGEEVIRVLRKGWEAFEV